MNYIYTTVVFSIIYADILKGADEVIFVFYVIIFLLTYYCSCRPETRSLEPSSTGAMLFVSIACMNLCKNSRFRLQMHNLLGYSTYLPFSENE